MQISFLLRSLDLIFNSRFPRFKFNKWRKKMSLASETGDNVAKFKWKNFGVLGKQSLHWH